MISANHESLSTSGLGVRDERVVKEMLNAAVETIDIHGKVNNIFLDLPKSLEIRQFTLGHTFLYTLVCHTL